VDGPDDEERTRRVAAERILAVEIDQVVRALHGTAVATGSLLGTGVPAAPGAGSGPLVTTFDAALDAADDGWDPVLVVAETGPADEPAMRCAAAVVTTRGGLASHAAVVARAWGLPAVCGLSAARVDDEGAWFDGVRVSEGEWITVDGGTGEVRAGGADHAAGYGLDRDLLEVLDLCDRLVAGRPGVWVNADTADEVRAGLDAGARGVGLCRTEHQFLGERLGALQALLLGGPDAADAAETLQGHQHEAVTEVLRAAGGVPVVVRLLDPPLHEFLPSLNDERAPAELVDLARHRHEHNPMLGVRGVRLGVVAPQVVDAQLRGLLGALAQAGRDGVGADLRLLVPMVAWAGEVDRVVEQVWLLAERFGVDAPPVGAMVETPAAALRAAELGRSAAFLSIGSNDLTQLTLGLSRDDTETSVVGEYLRDGLLDRSPFQTLDPSVVGLLAGALRDAPDAHWGRCGEHAGDPDSLARLASVPLDHVSCSPYRVPVARLALGRIAAASLLGAGTR
jgi:pyruvate,orthophosphate dikinase